MVTPATAMTPIQIVYAAANPATVLIQGLDKKGQWQVKGSGFLYRESPDAPVCVVTARHVIEERGLAYTVTLASGVVLKALRIKKAALDVAVLTLPQTQNFTTLTLAQSDPIVGTEVFQIGYPLTCMDPVIGQGHVNTYYCNTMHDEATLGYDAPQTHGDSGGPVLDSQGKVVGICDEGSDITPFLGRAIPVSTLRAQIKPLTRA